MLPRESKLSKKGSAPGGIRGTKIKTQRKNIHLIGQLMLRLLKTKITTKGEANSVTFLATIQLWLSRGT